MLTIEQQRKDLISMVELKRYMEDRREQMEAVSKEFVDSFDPAAYEKAYLNGMFQEYCSAGNLSAAEALKKDKEAISECLAAKLAMTKGYNRIRRTVLDRLAENIHDNTVIRTEALL